MDEENRYDDAHAAESVSKAETGSYEGNPDARPEHPAQTDRPTEEARADHDPVRDPEPGAETIAARQAADERRQPNDPDGNHPAASPNSGNPGAVPDPEFDPEAKHAEEVASAGQREGESFGEQQEHHRF